MHTLVRNLIALLVVCTLGAGCTLPGYYGRPGGGGSADSGSDPDASGTPEDPTAPEDPASPGHSGPGYVAPMRREVVCAQTLCQRAEAQCRDRLESAVRRCQVDCVEAFGLYTNHVIESCRRGCEEQFGYDRCGMNCSPDSACVRFEYRFTLGGIDPQVLRACERVAAVDRDCRRAATFADCNHAARVFSPAIVPLLECIAEARCATSWDTCQDRLPAPSHRSAELCDALGGRCDVGELCTPAARQQFDGNTTLLRDDVWAALTTCFDEPTCDDAEGCISGWNAAASASR
jgi:hypothetical protein